MANDGVRRAAMLGWAPSVLAALDEEEAGDALDLSGKVNKAGDTVTGDLLLASGRPWVSIRAKGAVGNFAATDDRVAIQSAIDAAATLAVATGTSAVVYIDAGTYGFSINPSSATPKRAFTAKPNVVVTGPGKLKLRDNQGNYGAIFGADIGVDASGFELNAVKIDLNATNNAVPTSGDMTVGDNNESRAIVHISKGNDVKVHRCLFKDVGDLVNGILVNGHATGADDFVCTDNQFLQVGQAAFAHDCSVIYWHGTRCDVSRNVFKARSAGLGGCTAAIELHGPGQTCDGNYVENFMLGGYVTGISENATEVSGWRRNHFIGVAGGIMLLPNTFDTFTSGYALRHISVDRNVILVDRDQWSARTNINGDTGFASGIFLQEGADLPCDDVAITNNSVGYLASSQPSDAGWSYKNVAFSWMRNDTTIIDRNIQFTGNRSYGALSAGMALSGKCLGLTVGDNVHYDPGSHANLPGGASSPWRVGTLFLGTDPTCVTLERNGTVDTRGTHKLVANVYLIPVGTATDCSAIDNLPVNCADAANVPSVVAAGPAFFVRARDKTLAVAPSIPARFGSTWVSETTGAVYRQTSAPSGTAWGKELVPGTPTIVDHSDSAGVLTSVQLRYANALAAGGRVSWSAGGVTETGRIENELVSGTDAPLRLWMYASGLVEGAELRAAADGETALLLRRNKGGVFTLERVSEGAADSGGTGYRVLRVPN
jgi:hypothetical protein